MEHRNPTTYTMTELKKMSTDRLFDVHVEMFGAFPNTFVRWQIVSAIWGWTQEAAAFNQKMEERGRAHHMPQYLMGLVIAAASAKAPKFSDHDIRQMRIMKRAGYGYRIIAEVYGTSPAYAKKIVDRKLYKHVS